MTRRLILSLTFAMTFLWLLAVGLGLVVMEEELAEIFDGTLQDTAERLVPLVVDDLEHRGMLGAPSDNSPGAAPQQLQTASSSGDHEYLIYQVRDPSGRVLIRSHDAPEQAFGTPLKAGFWKNATYQFYTATSEDRRIFVQVADAFENREEAVREGAIALFLPLILLIPVSGMMIWLVVRRAVRPVGELRREIETKDGGNMEPIDASILPRELQPMLIAELTDSPSRHRAGQIEASLTRLSHLAEKLLQLSRAEAGIGIADKPADLGRILEMVLTDFWRGMANPSRLIFHRAPGAQLTGPFSEDAFAIVLRNLIENALVHGRPGEPVEVFLEDGGSVRIVNAAPAMTEADLASIRRRFSRGKTEAAGSGLGLSIVERLLGQMNGRLQLLSPASGRDDGFEARIFLA